MAKPAFIYTFDDLGPGRFTELAGLLLTSRYKGFLLGGVGADGGVDGQIDEVLGSWQPESASPLLNEIIQPGQLVVFQFKHKVTARVGQPQARAQLLRLYKCQANKTCELHSRLVFQARPFAYVLITNVEVNSQFRAKFIEQCELENPDIEHYQIIGLDELETWVTMEVELRHLYFPTIFGPPRFNLRIQITEGIAAFTYDNLGTDLGHPISLFQVSALNIGTVPSYISSIAFEAIVDGERKSLHILDFGNPIMQLGNPKFGTPLEPGQKFTYHYPFEVLRQIKTQGKEVFPFEVVVYDEIGNIYSATIPEHLRDKMLS